MWTNASICIKVFMILHGIIFNLIRRIHSSSKGHFNVSGLIWVKAYYSNHFMGALTLNIRNLHSSLGTTDIIEMDETRSLTIIWDGTFEGEGSRILL